MNENKQPTGSNTHSRRDFLVKTGLPRQDWPLRQRADRQIGQISQRRSQTQATKEVIEEEIK